MRQRVDVELDEIDARREQLPPRALAAQRAAQRDRRERRSLRRIARAWPDRRAEQRALRLGIAERVDGRAPEPTALGTDALARLGWRALAEPRRVPPRDRAQICGLRGRIARRRRCVVPGGELLVGLAPRTVRPQPRAERRTVGGARVGRCAAPARIGARDRGELDAALGAQVGVDVPQLRECGGRTRGDELRRRDRRSERRGAREVGERCGRAARESRETTRHQQPTEPRAVAGLPAHAEEAALALDLVELVERFARPIDLLVERGDREPRLQVSRIGEDADLEVAPGFDGSARRDELRDVERRRRSHAARNEHDDRGQRAGEHRPR